MNLLGSYQINLLHSLFLGPLLAWTGYKLNIDKSLSTIEKTGLLVAGLAAISYHGYKSFKHQQSDSSIIQNYGFKVNLLHLFFIGPLVAWTGYKLTKGKRVTDLEKTTLLFLGVAALMYHGYRAITNTTNTTNQ